MDRKYAPYAPAANILTAIRTFRERGFTGRVNTEVLESIGVPEGNAYRVLAALKWLGLVNADGNTSETMDAVRTAATGDYPVLLEGIVRRAYDEIFKYCNPATDDATRVSDAFRTFSPPVQRPKMVTAFLALCKEAGIVSGEVAERVPNVKPTRKTQGGQRLRVVKPPIAVPNVAQQAVPRGSGSVDRLLDKFPEFDPSWPDNIKEKWFDGFTRLQDELRK